MRQILSFIAVFLTGLIHSFPVEPDDQLNLFSLESDLTAEGVDTNIDLSYQPGEADDIFSSESVETNEFAFNDLDNPILVSDAASSAVSQCVGESIEPINVARSLNTLQPFDIAASQDGFCLQDGQEKPQIKLKFPTLNDLFNLDKPKPEGQIPPLNEQLGVWTCLWNEAQVVCCKPDRNSYITRYSCTPCKFLNNNSHRFCNTSSRDSEKIC